MAGGPVGRCRPPLCGGQRRRGGARHLQGPVAAADQPLPGPGGPGHRRLRGRRRTRLPRGEGERHHRAPGPDSGAWGAAGRGRARRRCRGAGPGPDLYLFGEETGLEEVIEGRPPLPRMARPYVQGLFARPPADNPTLVNNPETLAKVPHILADGPDWLRANGTEAAPGTMVFTICGDVRREGVFELPLGSPLRYLVEELAGGPPDGRAVKAIFPGASNTVISPEHLDLPLDFDSMRQAGSGLGAGGFAVFEDSACMVQAAWRYSRFLFVESCGQCPACKFGTGEVTETLQALEVGAGSDRDLELILVRARGSTGGQKCALPTGESLLMQSLVQGFREEFASHVGRSCPLPRALPFHKLVDWDATAGRFTYDLAYADKQPDWTYPS